MTKALRRACAPVAAVLLAVAAGVAQAEPPPPKGWEVQVKIYAWAAALDAEVEARGVETKIDESFWSILDDLGWAVMGGAEGRFQRGLLLVDFMGMQTATDLDVGPRTYPFALRDGRVGDLTAGGIESTTRLTQWMVDTKLGFRVLSLPMTKLSGSPDDPADLRRLDFDLLAGFRYWNVTAKVLVDVDPAVLTVDGTNVPIPDPLPRLRSREVRVPGVFLRGTRRWVEDTVDWFDPIVGFRVSAGVTRRFSLNLLGDIGGWSLGEASDLTWQALGGARFDLSEHWSLALSYRAIGVNRDSALRKTIMHGPQFGAVFRF